MAIRATDALVEQICDVDPDITLDIFHSLANNMVEEHCVDAVLTNDEPTLTHIETLLSAHFYSVRDADVNLSQAAVGRGAVSVSYIHKADLGLNHSRWGQMAMQLDKTGGLAAWNKAIAEGKTQKPKVTYLGKNARPSNW